MWYHSCTFFYSCQLTIHCCKIMKKIIEGKSHSKLLRKPQPTSEDWTRELTDFEIKWVFRVSRTLFDVLLPRIWHKLSRCYECTKDLWREDSCHWKRVWTRSAVKHAATLMMLGVTHVRSVFFGFKIATSTIYVPMSNVFDVLPIFCVSLCSLRLNPNKAKKDPTRVLAHVEPYCRFTAISAFCTGSINGSVAFKMSNIGGQLKADSSQSIFWYH